MLTSNEKKKKKRNQGILVEPMPNSPNFHHKSIIADSKENY